MDHVVHINNGGEDARPIVLHLLPGEETIFNLKIVNHGEPSNITLEASDPVFKAVRLKRPDSYVVMEETIPVMTRMPENVDHLEGEILLTSSAGISRVPIRLLQEAEDPGEDLEEPRERRDEEPWDDLRKDDLNGDRDIDEGESEDKDEDEDGWKDESYSSHEDQGAGEKEPETDSDIEETEARPIRFSRHKDLQSYKAASRPRRIEEPAEAPIEERIEDEVEERIEARIPVEERRAPREYESAPRDRHEYGRDSGYVSREYRGEAEIAPEAEAETETESYDAGKTGIMDVFGENGALQVIPIGILLALIFVLVMTFITESIPEFPGALASSILIVTLIIYGAATLLKA